MAEPDIAANFAAFNRNSRIKNLYPTEFVIRTMLGKYPRLSLDKSKYPGSKILDLGFGDGRNFGLLADLDMRISGTEISQEMIDAAKTRFADLALDLRLGSNSSIPFDDATFDYVLACHSCYYIKPGETFADNVREIARVLKPGGTFIFSFPRTDNFILKGAVEKSKHHFEVKNDPFGLRNGSLMAAFDTQKEVEKAFTPHFADIRSGTCLEDYYGLVISALIGVATRT